MLCKHFQSIWKRERVNQPAPPHHRQKKIKAPLFSLLLSSICLNSLLRVEIFVYTICYKHFFHSQSLCLPLSYTKKNKAYIQLNIFYRYNLFTENVWINAQTFFPSMSDAEWKKNIYTTKYEIHLRYFPFDFYQNFRERKFKYFFLGGKRAFYEIVCIDWAVHFEITKKWEKININRWNIYVIIGQSDIVIFVSKLLLFRYKYKFDFYSTLLFNPFSFYL